MEPVNGVHETQLQDSASYIQADVGSPVGNEVSRRCRAANTSARHFTQEQMVAGATVFGRSQPMYNSEPVYVALSRSLSSSPGGAAVEAALERETTNELTITGFSAACFRWPFRRREETVGTRPLNERNRKRLCGHFTQRRRVARGQSCLSNAGQGVQCSISAKNETSKRAPFGLRPFFVVCR